MATLTIDWLEGDNTVFERDGKPVEARRAALISGITQGVAAPPVPSGPVFDPTETERSGGGQGYWGQASAVLPQYGETHPDDKLSNLIVFARRIEAIDPGHARADILYRTADESPKKQPTTLRITAGLDAQTIHPTELVGEPGMQTKEQLVVSYQGVSQPVELDLFKPVVTAEMEKLTVTEAPLTDVFFFAGTVNGDSFLEQEPRTWLCSEVAATMVEQNSGDDVPLWRFRYRFELNKDTWDQEFAFRDTATGLVPKFSTQGELALGIKKFNFYPQSNFAGIGAGWGPEMPMP